MLLELDLHHVDRIIDSLILNGDDTHKLVSFLHNIAGWGGRRYHIIDTIEHADDMGGRDLASALERLIGLCNYVRDLTPTESGENSEDEDVVVVAATNCIKYGNYLSAIQLLRGLIPPHCD